MVLTTSRVSARWILGCKQTPPRRRGRFIGAVDWLRITAMERSRLLALEVDKRAGG